MCGRYSLAVANPDLLRMRFPIGDSVAATPHYNIAPGSEVLTVTTDRGGLPRGEMLRWGLVPSWASDTRTGFKMINARAETLTERAAYRLPFERFRCLILADGFYEWQTAPDARTKQPFHITRADRAPFAFAGLWSVWHRGAPDELRTCTIITTTANQRIASIHDRMPVILSSEHEGPWLDPLTGPDQLQGLLGGLRAAETEARRVGPAVNDARRDGPECLADPPPPTQDTLFDL
jgi:putative SOS response-associated peptidase YedK